MAATWAATGTNAGGFDGGFGSGAWTVTSATLGIGDIYLFLYDEQTSGTPVPSVVIDGVSATQVGSSQTNAGNDRASIWKATVTHTTGNIVITPGTIFATVAANWGLITGNGAPVQTNVQNSGVTTQGPITGTVPTNGVGVCSMGGRFGNGATTSWTGATVNTHMEGGIGTSNSSGVTGAVITAAGASSATASGSQWDFGNNFMAMLAFPASGGAAPPPSFGGFSDPVVISSRMVACKTGWRRPYPGSIIRREPIVIPSRMV